MEHGAAEMDTGRELKGVQVPAPGLHLVGEGVDVELLRVNGHDGDDGVAHHTDALNLLQLTYNISTVRRKRVIIGKNVQVGNICMKIV